MRVATNGLGAVGGLLVGISGALTLLSLPAAFGQEAGVDNKFLPAPRALVQRLNRAREAIQAERFNEAVEQLGSILSPDADEDLEGDIDQDYFIAPHEQGGAMPSLKTEAQRLLGSMPAAGRDMYELRYGATARDLLQQAVGEGDLTKLTEVTRRYFHTRAGYEAMMLLGRRHLDAGRPLAAALCFQRLAESPQALASYEPELSVVLAICWDYAGAPEKAESTLLSLAQRMPDARLEFNGEKLSIPRDAAAQLTWLSTLLGPRGTARQHEKDHWVLYRGDADRNASTVGGMPVANFRWRVPTLNDPNDEQALNDYGQQLASTGAVLIPATQPIAVKDVILMRTPRRLLAVDFSSGKRIWEFPWDETPDELAERSQEFPQVRNVPSQRMLELGERLWQDAAYGQISSDGDSAYVLADLSFASPGSMQHMIQPGGFQQANPGWPKPYNKLVALSLARQGALRWVVGGEDGADEPKLAGAFFLGVPLPAMGQLFVLAELSGELRLVVLSAETGHLEWQQQLAHVDTLTIQTDLQRRLSGATPSFADGVLVCPTSAGAVVALDVSDRSLLWGYQYPTNVTSLNNRFAFNRPVVRSPGEEGWLDATATIAGGRVILTPAESDELHCLDLLTGEPAWSAHRRGDALYVACVHENKIILVGKSSVQALNLEDGMPAWSQDVSLEEAQPSGRGFYSGDAYYLPTSTAKLLKIDLAEGRVVEQTDTRRPLGNLICYQDELISQNADWLMTFYQREPLRRLVEEKLAANPEDRWALSRKCELLLQDGKRKEALEVMWATYQQDQSDEGLKALLVQTLLDALQEDFAGHLDRVRQLEHLIEGPEQRAQYLRLLSTGLEQLGDFAGAFQATLELADTRRTSGEGLLREPSPEAIDRSWSVVRQRWIQGRIGSLLKSAAGDEHAAMRAAWQREIVARRDKTLAGDSRPELRSFLEQFGSHPAADPVRLEYARRLVADGEWLAAELQLTGLLQHQQAEIAAPAHALMSELLVAAGRVTEATPLRLAVVQRWPQVPVHGEQTGREWAEQAEQQESMRGTAEIPHAWPYGHVEAERSAEIEQALAGTQRMFPVQMRDAQGLWPMGTSIVIDSRSNSIVVYDPFGRGLQQVPMNAQRSPYSSYNSLSHGRASGHLAILSLQGELVALDLLRLQQDTQQTVLWRMDLNENSTAPNVRVGGNPKTLRHPWSHTGVRAIPSDTSPARVPLANMGPVTRHGICYQRYREVICADPLTGEVIWKRDGFDPGVDFFGDSDLLFVVPYDKTEAIVLDAATGADMGRRPVDKLESRWSVWGRNVLAWKEEDGNKLLLKLYDAWSQDVLWQQQFASGSRGELISEEEVAVMQPTGELTILSLRTGQVTLQQSLDPVPGLAYLYVQPSSEQYLVLAGLPVSPMQRLSIMNPSAATPVVQGRLYAFNRRNGQLQWPTAADIEQYAVPLVQPAESPVLVLLRNITYRAPQNRQTGSILCIDKRDGRVLLSEDDLPRQISAYQVTANPGANEVQIGLNGQAYSLRFTDKPQPPAPPAQTGDAASLPNPFTANRVRQWAGSVVDVAEALGRQPRQEGERSVLRRRPRP